MATGRGNEMGIPFEKHRQQVAGQRFQGAGEMVLVLTAVFGKPRPGIVRLQIPQKGERERGKTGKSARILEHGSN